MKKIYLLVLVSCIGFIGCEKVVDADNLLDTKEKIFINGYLSPSDTLLRIRVSKALPIIGTPLSRTDNQINKNIFLVKNALVTISNEDGDIVNLNYSEESEAYIALPSSLPILEDERYFLKVIVKESEFNASCKIPKKVENITETVSLYSDELGNRKATIKLAFNDFAGVPDFYILGGYAKVIFEEQESYINRLDFNLDRFLTDTFKDGTELNAENTILLNNQDEIEILVKLQVAHVEALLYQNLRASELNNYNEGNPFIEYSIAPDNIEEENGIGVFAGYSLTEKIISIKKNP
ncbi:MAG: DUF4249 family protein [Cellulophaga sp.]